MLGEVSFCAPSVSVVPGYKLSANSKGVRSDILDSIAHGAKWTSPTHRGG